MTKIIELTNSEKIQTFFSMIIFLFDSFALGVFFGIKNFLDIHLKISALILIYLMFVSGTNMFPHNIKIGKKVM